MNDFDLIDHGDEHLEYSVPWSLQCEFCRNEAVEFESTDEGLMCTGCADVYYDALDCGLERPNAWTRLKMWMRFKTWWLRRTDDIPF